MQKAIDHPPRTIMEVFQGLPEGTLAELIDNQIYMSPSPIFKHQKILQILFRKLSNVIIDQNNGEVLMAPFDVYLDETSNAVQPDIVVVLEQNLSIIANSHGNCFYKILAFKYQLICHAICLQQDITINPINK